MLRGVRAVSSATIFSPVQCPILTNEMIIELVKYFFLIIPALFQPLKWPIVACASQKQQDTGGSWGKHPVRGAEDASSSNDETAV